jgi:phosphohistidine phosphatase
MKPLYLLRHAKSSWDDPAVPDRERPLAPRGRKATALLAGHIRDAQVAPDLILCSPARRTLETLDGIVAALGRDASIETEEELYGASAGALLERIRAIPGAVPSAMIIGHNPGLQQLAVDLVSAGSAREQLEQKYPTGALATLAIECEWHEVDHGAGTLVNFVRPKDLR